MLRFVVAAALTPCAACVVAQPTAILTGRIVDAASALGVVAEVTVLCTDTAFKAQADSTGSFRMEGLPTGIASVQATARGYAPTALPDLWLRSGKPEHVELALERGGRELPEV